MNMQMVIENIIIFHTVSNGGHDAFLPAFKLDKLYTMKFSYFRRHMLKARTHKNLRFTYAITENWKYIRILFVTSINGLCELR